ncbi:MAG: hypothetical protein ACODAD_09145 [Planctomycetota bacterium]
MNKIGHKMSLRKPVVAVHWGQSTLDYVVADRKSGKIYIRSAGSVSWDPQEDERTPGEVLRDELQQLGVRRAELVVALGRGSVDVIPLHTPPAGDAELPTLVSNQVMRDAGEIAETGVVDFVAIPAIGDEPRTGFAFCVEAVEMERVMAEARKASLKPTEIVYRPLASITLLRRVVPQSQRIVILVTRHNREADISIVRGGGIVYTRTARLGETLNIGDIASQLAMEVRRSLAAASLVPDEEEQHLYMFGALQETEQLVQELAEELSLPASLLDPLRVERVEGSTPEAVGRLAPLLGMVYDHYGKKHAVDFLHPKKPAAPPNPWRRVGGYAAAVILLLAVGGYTWWQERAETAREIAEMKTTLNNTLTHLNKVREKQAVVNAVWQWERTSFNWLDEFYDLARRFPSGREAMVRRFSVAPGRINMTVHVSDPEVITKMDNELQDAFHRVRTKGVTEQPTFEDYPWQFQTQITLRPRTTQQYRSQLPAEKLEEDPRPQETPAEKPEQEPSGDIALSGDESPAAR